jgi:hypothetical protein
LEVAILEALRSGMILFVGFTVVAAAGAVLLYG